MNKELRLSVPLRGSLQEHVVFIDGQPSDEGDFVDLSQPYCEHCGKFIPTRAYHGWEKGPVRLEDLRRVIAESRGCDICKMIVEGLVAYRDEALPDAELPESFVVSCVPGKHFTITKPEVAKSRIIINATSTPSSALSDPDSTEILGTHGLEFFTTQDAAWCLRHVGVGRPVARDISGDECLQLAREWISSCQANHPICQQWPGSTLPTRLIHVGSDMESPHLVEGLADGARYAALSHCWGKSQPLTTTSGTINERRQEIPLHSLPKTFRDAVIMTRKLDLEYIWIDSLCIIQDSPKDWEVESARMGDVYSGATVTLAATSAPDGRGGLFIEKEKLVRSVSFDMDGIQGQHLTVHVRSADNGEHDISQNGLFETHPLSRRGWVLQETLLSTRILLYTSCELVFECQTELWCECGDFPYKLRLCAEGTESGERDSRSSGHAITSWPWKALLTKALLDILTWTRDHLPLLGRFFGLLLGYAEGKLLRRQDSFRFWRMIIETYTRRCLTFDKDTLPALSGLAQMLQGRVLDSYVAGLWREDMHKQLLWSKRASSFSLTPEEYALLKSLPDEKIHQHYLPFRARRTADPYPPTWSWTSIRAATGFGGKWLPKGRLTEGLADIRAVSCKPATADPYGSVVSGGYIVLYAPIAPVRLGSYEVNLRDVIDRCRVAELTCAVDDHEHSAAGCFSWNGEEWAVLDLPPDEGTTALEEQKFWRVQIAKNSPPHYSAEIIDYAGRPLLGRLADEISQSHTIIYHLLLRKKNTGDFTGTSFERVGLFVKIVPLGIDYQSGRREIITIF